VVEEHQTVSEYQEQCDCSDTLATTVVFTVKHCRVQWTSAWQIQEQLIAVCLYLGCGADAQRSPKTSINKVLSHTQTSFDSLSGLGDGRSENGSVLSHPDNWVFCYFLTQKKSLALLHQSKLGCEALTLPFIAPVFIQALQFFVFHESFDYWSACGNLFDYNVGLLLHLLVRTDWYCMVLDSIVMYFILYLIVFDCIWLYLIVFGCIWLYLIVFDCIWLFLLYLIVFGCIWLYLVVFGCTAQ